MLIKSYTLNLFKNFPGKPGQATYLAISPKARLAAHITATATIITPNIERKGATSRVPLTTPVVVSTVTAANIGEAKNAKNIAKTLSIFFMINSLE